jgi:hypothetical protein
VQSAKLWHAPPQADFALLNFGDGVLFWILLEELERFQFCVERFVGDELAVDHCCCGYVLYCEAC